jgi:hypothetical protein
MLIVTNQLMVDFHGQKVFHDDQITMRKWYIKQGTNKYELCVNKWWKHTYFSFSVCFKF